MIPLLCNVLSHQQREAGPWLGSQFGPGGENLLGCVSGRTRSGREAPGDEEALWVMEEFKKAKGR